MKYAVPAFLLAALTAFLLYRAIDDAVDGQRSVAEPEIRVALAYNASLLKKYGNSLEAFKSVLAEEGVPFQTLDTNDFFKLDPEDFARRRPALIFPDGVNQLVPRDIRAWIYSYVLAGGSVAVIYDAGLKDLRGFYFARGQFADLLGLDYSCYDRLRDKAYTIGSMQFRDEDAMEYFEIPQGCYDSDRYLTSYLYGRLEFPIAHTAWIDETAKANARADVVASSEDEHFPAVIVHRYGRSRVLYANLPLGYIKGQSYDLLLRSVLRSFLFKELQLPHLSNVPFGKPILIFNWHIDNGLERDDLPRMVDDNYFRQAFEYSIDITAGDYLEDPGDGAGFDACGKGWETVVGLERYGTVGSHGGWAHNWFSNNIDTRTISNEEMFEAIDKNSDCLSTIVGHPVVEYAAPGGSFPQPITGRYLDQKSYIAYYNTGDAGSAPNRTFWNGRMVSPDAISFPIAPMHQAASFFEIAAQYQYDPEDFRQWMSAVLAFTIRHGVVRLLYSHPYDIYYYFTDRYREAFSDFLDELEEAQYAGEVAVRSMTYYADYFLRFLATNAKYTVDDGDLTVDMHNDQSLVGVTVSVPKNRYMVDEAPGCVVTETPDDYLVAISDDVQDKTICAGRL